jgi:hypothetical protein
MDGSTGGPRRARALGRRMMIAAVGVTAVASVSIGSVLAAPPNVALGTAVVDGVSTEWGAADRFADLFVYGNRSDVRGDVYARYDCAAETLYVYVAATDGQLRADQPTEAWVRIDDEYRSVRGDSGNDGVPPDFAWVGLDGVNATGYEASMIMSPGSHTMFLHVHQWFDDADLALSLVIIRDTPIVATCTEPSPSPEVSPSPSPEVSPSPSPEVSPSPSPEVSPSPSPEVSPSPSPSPSPDVSPSPSGPVDPGTTASPSPSPTGEVKGVTFAPTPPPTDRVDGRSTGQADLLPVIAGLGLLSLALVLAPRLRGDRRR